MSDFRHHFALPDDAIWLNTAHQGALPRRAADEAARAIEWKLDPRELTSERFAGVPERLRTAIARLVGADLRDIALTNGSSYGLHLLANGIPLGAGDEVLTMAGDFPSNVLPWLGLRERGVEVRVLEPRRTVLTPEEIEAALTPRTRVVCLSWVHSFSGHVLDVASIGELCRQRSVWFLVNGTQGIGARPFDLAAVPCDALVCSGWKWLCGPYGTGFLWLRRDLCDALTVNRRYWLSLQTADDLGATEDRGAHLDPRTLGARRYDVFGTANFFNFVPYAASLELIGSIGVEAIQRHVDRLVGRLVGALAELGFEMVSPVEPERRSALVLFRGRGSVPDATAELFERLRRAGVSAALRRGSVRLSPHLYNSAGEIDRALEALG